MFNDPPAFGSAEALKMLQTVSEITARAATDNEVIEGALHTLLDSGLIAGAMVEIGSVPPVRYVVGEGIPLFGDLPLNSYLSRAEHLPHPLRQLPESVRVLEIPTRASPDAWGALALRQPLTPAFLTILLQQIALVLDRTFLQQRVRDLDLQTEQGIHKVETVYEIGRAMDSMDIDRLLEVITERAARVMNAQACSLMRLNPDTQALTIAASYGLSEDVVFVTQRALGEGIAGRVAQTGEPMLIVDAQSDPRLAGLTLRPDIGSSMVVPMKDEEGRVTGILSIRRRRPAPDFDHDDLRLFSVFASQAALSINNKQLYDDLHRRVKELSTLSALTQAVISHLDLTNLLENVADSIVEVVKFDRCCIYLLDRQTRRLIPRILRGYRPEVIGRNPIRIGEGVVGLVAKKQMPIVAGDARNAPQPIRGFARALGTGSFLALPVVAKGQTIGVVVADNKLTRRPIHEESLELLSTFVNQAGLAIENAQLYEDREQRYQEMNRLATQTDNILRSIAASVVVVSPEGRVVRWNKASEEMWGIVEEQANNQSYSRLVDGFGLPVDQADRLRGMMHQVMITGRPIQRYKLPLNTLRHGETFINVLLSPWSDQQGDRYGVVQIMEDVTREVKMEADMERIRRLADIGQLAAKMAHEVRNPLSSIKGAAQLMRNEYEHLAPMREFLDIIIEEVNGLSKITTDLLDFARPMQLELKRVNLFDLVERTRLLMSGMLEEQGVLVQVHHGEEPPVVECDPKQIEQVIRNIFLNAVQAMPEGGTIAVSAQQEPTGERVTMRFCDTGVGVTEDRMEVIFQPFFTTKTKGTGLGLAIVRKIVEKHGGLVSVSSRVGEGTCFSVTLPVQPPYDPTAHELPKDAPRETPVPITSSLPDA